MARTNKSARNAGTAFERLIANHLQEALDQPSIDRLVKTGTKDRGDIGNVRDHQGRLIAIECKNTTRTELPKWAREAHTEATNYHAAVGITIHKRHGTAKPGEQWVHMTVDDLITLITIKEDTYR